MGLTFEPRVFIRLLGAASLRLHAYPRFFELYLDGDVPLGKGFGLSLPEKPGRDGVDTVFVFENVWNPRGVFNVEGDAVLL